MSVEVRKVRSAANFKAGFEIREKVFVVEQHVPPEHEYDQYEESSNHFLAFLNDQPVGAARWRFTEKGVKLERFAVLKEARGKGVGSALVKAVLDDLDSNEEARGLIRYLNSQLPAIPLYGKFGFEQAGEMFVECDIEHYYMELDPSK